MNLHYELTGPAGAPLVLLSNAIGTDLTMWDQQVPALAEHFRVLRYDQRGHGRSPATPGPYDLDLLGSDVLSLLDQVGVERAHFAGVSLGGMTGMWLAGNAPDRLDRLALICTSPYLGPASNWLERAELVRERGTGTITSQSLAKWFTPATAERPDIVDKYGGMLAATDDGGYAGCCAAIASMDLRGKLTGVTTPTLVIAGRDDPATPPSHAEQIAGEISGARVEVVDHAAHLANAEQPETVNRLLVEHFGAANQ